MSNHANPDKPKKLKAKKYEKELRKLQAELCKLQEWVKYKGLRVIIVFGGRDAAGKGGAIKAMTERVSPRVFRLVALPAPSDREKSQMYFQRYMPHFPAAGEVVIFDRSWYNRAGVEYVMGFCTKDQHSRFLKLCPETEKYIVDGGIQLIKVWQRRRGPRIRTAPRQHARDQRRTLLAGTPGWFGQPAGAAGCRRSGGRVHGASEGPEGNAHSIQRVLLQDSHSAEQKRARGQV